jgi:ABC-type sugar transport system, permease component
MSSLLLRRARTIAWYVGATCVALLTVTPLLWTLSTSFKPAGEILASGFRLIPQTFTLDNYEQALTTVPFGRYMLNSAFLAVVGVATNLFFGGMAGYAFAKLRFRAKQIMFYAFLASMMIPTVVTMIPLFLILRHFPFAGGNDLLGNGGTGLINTYWAVILPWAAGGFAIFFMRQFFETLPDDLAEAARIEGASEFRIFRQIYLPLAKAPLAVLGILTFQAGWNNFMWPLIVLNEPEMMTIQVGLAAFINDHQTDYGPLMAGTLVGMSIPPKRGGLRYAASALRASAINRS